MWPFPKTLLKWREPKAFVETTSASDERHLRPWLRPLLMLLTIGLAIASWYLATLDPSKTPVSYPTAVALALFLGIFCVYIVPMINSRLPSEVKIFSNCIIRMRGNSYLRCARGEIESYSWVTDKGFFTLVVNAGRKRPALYGVPDADTKERIEAVFSSLGVQQLEAGATGDGDADAPSS